MTSPQISAQSSHAEPSTDTATRGKLTGGRLLRAELWVLEQLAEPALFDGATTREQRCGILRAYLLSHGLATDRWRSAFERLYGEPLGDAP